MAGKDTLFYGASFTFPEPSGGVVPPAATLPSPSIGVPKASCRNGVRIPPVPEGTAGKRALGRRDPRWSAVLAAVLVPVALGILCAAPAFAIGRDFMDETLVAGTLKVRELGFQLGTDSRVDRDYRLQGWLWPELELGVTERWIVEGVASFVNRGRGLEFGTWRVESRYLVLQEPRWPLALAVSAEYEVETRAAKRLSLERMIDVRAIATRTFAGSLLATANWGIDRRLVPFPRTASMYAFGLRFPEPATIAIGFEYRHQTVESETRLGPMVRIRLPHDMKLRLGGSFGHKPSPYRFIGRVILETEL